ncbi:MAG: hypothetical protein RL026_734 [Pseudomonadota bacterium]|jgi:mono/diheme cytochrome c family protein
MSRQPRHHAALGGIAAVALLAAPAVQAAAATDPEALFNARCGVCHLAGGGGTWMLERRLGKEQSLLARRSDLQPAYIRYVARFGLRAMPRFTPVELPDAELDAIAVWLTRPGSRP